MCDGKQIKKYYMQKGEAFCICLLVCSPFLKIGKFFRKVDLCTWTCVVIDIRWVYKYSTAFDGELWFKSIPCSMAWRRGVRKGQPGTEMGGE